MRSYLCRLTALPVFALALSVQSLAPAARAADAPAAAAGGSEWANWRGPAYNGSSEAKNLPEKFSPTENLLWKTKLPGPSHGTPILSGGKVFTTAIDSNRKMHAICLDQKEGKVLWDKEIGISQINRKGENDVATPSPVTDGKIVYFVFGTGDIAAFDVDGKSLWARNLQKEIGEWNINWIYGSSPALYKGKLYIQVLHRESPWKGAELPGAAKYPGGVVPSYLLALDPATGKELWRHDRPTDAVNETKESYATPIPNTDPNGRDELLLIGGDAVTGHDPETGKELWRYTGWDPRREQFWRLIPSVTVGGGFVIACAPKDGPVMGIPDGCNGDVSKDPQAWVVEGRKMTSDVSVPLFYKGQFFVLGTNSKKLYSVVPVTGEIKWTINLGGGDIFRASPTGADGRIYCMNRGGEVWVVSPEDGKVLHQTSLDVPKGAYGSIAVTDGMLVIRAGDTMFAFGKK